MRITSVDTTLLRLPEVLPTGDGLQDLLVIEVTTDEGVTGLGEAHTMPLALQAIIRAPLSQWAVQGLGELLVGQDPSDIAGLWQLMWDRCGSVLGGRGLVMHAMSGIDIALWDIAAQVAGVPLHEVLRRRARPDDTASHPRVDVYASDLMPSSAAALLSRAKELTAAGHRSLKFGWGKLGLTPQEDVDVLTELREQLGPDVRLMVDVGVPMEFDDALWLAGELAKIDVTFLEEPLDAADLDGYAHLSAAASLPIAAGERESSRAGFVDLIERAGLAIVQPDLARCGGITVAMQIAEMAAARDRWVVPHCWSSDILVGATAHFLAALSQRPLLEFNVMDQPLRTRLTRDPFRPVDGTLALPDRPGLGVELDPSAVEEFRWDPS